MPWLKINHMQIQLVDHTASLLSLPVQKPCCAFPPVLMYCLRRITPSASAGRCPGSQVLYSKIAIKISDRQYTFRLLIPPNGQTNTSPGTAQQDLRQCPASFRFAKKQTTAPPPGEEAYGFHSFDDPEAPSPWFVSNESLFRRPANSFYDGSFQFNVRGHPCLFQSAFGFVLTRQIPQF